MRVEVMKEKMNLRLTARDLELMCWMNRVRFVTIEQIAKWLKIALPTAYGRIKKLVQHNYLQHERVFHGALGVYQVSLLGAQVSGSLLPPLRKLPLATYHHDLTVINLSFILVAKYSGQFIYERELRHQEGLYRFGEAGHIADGLLVYGNKRIAIEVELTKKGKRRREQIINHYLKNFDCNEVWYFCGNEEIENQIKPLVEQSPFIHVHSLNQFLGTHNG